ncbi:MAG: tetratricopeptide repeat protein [Rhodospirillales bacterium]|nr:tetratricopeptide repeat protein [Rhodospirillales bacterium]
MNRGVAAHRQGRLDEAASCYEQALRLDPRNADALNLLGTAHFQAGQPARAVELVGKAVAARPNFPDAHLNLGSALAALGRLDEAIAHFEKATRQAPNNPNAHYNLGLALQSKGRFEDSAKRLARALALAPNHPGAWMALGTAKIQLNEPSEAEAAFRKAIALDPKMAEAHLNLGNVLFEGKRVEEAEEACRRAQTLDSALPRPHHLLGKIAITRSAWQTALGHFQDALARDASLIEGHVNLASCLNELGRFEEAESAAKRALVLDPGSMGAVIALGASYYGREMLAPALTLFQTTLAAGLGDAPTLSNNLAQALTMADRLDEAIGILDELTAGAANPAPYRLSQAICHLNRGELERGWDLYESRWASGQQGSLRNFLQPRWDRVADLAGQRVLVWKEQGIGDEMTFASALPDLIAKAGTVIVETTPKLVPIFARSFPQAEIRPEDRSQDQTRDDFDIHLPIGDLFCGLRRSIEDFPKRPAYLKADPARAAHWRERLAQLGPKLKVGIAWRSSFMSLQRLRTYFADLEPWGPILAVPGVDFISLQTGDAEAEIAKAEQDHSITLHRFPEIDMFNDLDEVGALMSALDLVIAPGLSVPVQSAALGVPTWIILLRNNHWDLLGTDGLPWLPAAEIFLRNFGSGWSEPIARIAERLAALAARKGTTTP